MSKLDSDASYLGHNLKNLYFYWKGLLISSKELRDINSFLQAKYVYNNLFQGATHIGDTEKVPP